MAIQQTVSSVSGLVVSEGETKNKDKTFEYGPEGSRFRTSHTAPVWGRLFSQDKEGDNVLVELYKWLLENGEDPAAIRKGAEEFAEFVRKDKAKK